ncbi:AMP-dependent synthetase/ligase [Penicillium brevicompactum]|uniref:AMP-dependent synthetase/ligase n=1 Tax=Penicillium brevicompactum TaxID=5074 RepID=A0A9W9R2B4_PENBR|nr:AMP-dependent synthetase/ligase [Penicillium brevicompactum]
MQDSQILSHGESWEWCFELSTHSGDVHLPPTAVPFQDAEPNCSISGEIQHLDIGCLGQETFKDGVKSLIDGYARWIMAVSGQREVSFWIVIHETNASAKLALVVAKRADEGDDLGWEAHGATGSETNEVHFALSLGGGGPETILPDSVRVALSVEMQTSPASLTYRGVSQQAVDILHKVNLESYLRSFDAASFWRNELHDFVGCAERPFPSISCDRLMVPAGSSQTLTETLLMGVSWKQLETAARNYHLRSVLPVIHAAFACILTEYIESDRLIVSDRALTTPRGKPSQSLLPILISKDDTAQSVFARIDEFVARSEKVSGVSPDLAREILQIPPEGTIYNAIFTHHVEETSCQESEPPLGMSVLCSDAPVELGFRRLDKGELILTLTARAELIDQAHLKLALQQIDALAAIMISRPMETIQDLSQSFPADLLSIHTHLASEQLKNAPLLSPAHWVDHWAAIDPTWKALEIIEEINEDETRSQTWTYKELSQTSDQLSAWIKARGWQRRSIAVCLNRSFMAYALVLAIWKSGNCYVPVAEDLPEARQIFLLADSGAIAFFTDQNVAENIVPPEDCLVISIDDPKLLTVSGPAEGPAAGHSSPEDDCYLLYTSGSTGTPKGVLVSRGNLSAFTEAQSEYICRDVPDTPNLKGAGSYLAHASRAFDVHICEMVLGWRHGLRLVTGPRTMLLDNLFLVLSKLRITHAGFVPSLLEHAGVSAELLPDLRYLGVGGEKISETIIERFVGKPSIALVNAYGPTEVTIGMTSHTVKPWSTVRNIGTAVGNITIHVLETDSLRYVKRGQAGELCVTGDLVANGYHRRPDAGGFIDFNGKRMYRTGDIVRLMANNCVEYLGRRDSQAKIRGQRLELEEVSVAVRRCANFPINVTSIVTPSPITKRPQLVSFISPSRTKPDSAPTKPTFLKEQYQEWVPEILARCTAELPAYMVPSILLPISSIPIQISGKADTRRLVALYESIPVADLLLKAASTSTQASDPDEVPCTKPLTTNEERIRDIVCAQLRVDADSITRTTNIFSLGMDSLASLAVASSMRKAGYLCAAADVLSNATVAQLACLPRDHRTSTRTSSGALESQADDASQRLVQIDKELRGLKMAFAPSSISAVWPCLPLQESIVSNSVGNPNPLYVNHMMCRLGPGISLPALRLAFEDLIYDNEILRTCFHVREDKILQLVLKPRVTELPWNQVPVSNESDACALFKSLQGGIASRIIDGIEIKPPFHLLAAESVDGESGWLMLSIHHSIFDGASMGIFLGRLHQHYTGIESMHPINLTPLYNHLMKSDTTQDEKFWTEHLKGCVPTVFPYHVRDNDYLIVCKQLPFSLSALSRFASQHRTTASMVLETAWAITLAKELGQNDVLYGRVMSGRGIPVEEIESMLVPLVTTIPGRLKLSSGKSSFLSKIQMHTQAIIASMPYQHTPLRAIQRYSGASGPLFDCMFSYLAIGPQSPSDKMLLEMDSSMQVDYPLALEVKAESDPDTVTLRLRIGDAPSSDQKANAFVEQISTLVEELVSNGDSVFDAPILSGHEEPKHRTWDENEWTENETILRQAVAEVSGMAEHEVSKNVSFFALGIDSVISLHLSRRLQQKGLKVTSSDILRYSSIGALQERLKAPTPIAKEPPVIKSSSNPQPNINPFDENDAIVETYPCTPLQTAMIGQCLSSEGKGYVHHHSVALDASIDLDRLVNAWKVLTERVDVLRTTFHRQDGSREIRAAVHQTPLVNWTHEADIESLPVAIERISRQVAYPAIKDFEKPPWRVTFLTEGKNRLMVVTMHHCLYDGFSLPILFDVLEQQYNGVQVNIHSFASTARKVASTQVSSVKFWTDSVLGYQCQPVRQQSASNSVCKVQWAESTVKTPMVDLQRQCGLLNVTLQTVALLAFGRSLALHLGQRDVVFGHVVSGRASGIDHDVSVIGPLFNTVPFRLKLESASQSVRSALQGIQNFCIDSQPHHHAPLALIQREWRSSGDENSLALLNAIFSFNKSGPPTAGSIFQPYNLAENPDVPQYPLNVEFEQTQDCLIIRATSLDVMGMGEGGLDTWVLGVAQGIENIISSGDEPVLSFPQGLQDLPEVISRHQGQLEEPVDAVVMDQDVQTLKNVLSDITHIPMDQIQNTSGVFALGMDSVLALDMSARCRQAGLKVSVSDILQGGTIQGIAALAAKRITAISASAKPINSQLALVNKTARAQILSSLSLIEDDVESILPSLSGQLFYLSAWLRSKRKLWEFSFALKSSIKLDLDRLQDAWDQLQKRHEILRTCFTAISPSEVFQVVRKPTHLSSIVTSNLGQSAEDLNHCMQVLLGQIATDSSDLFTPPVRLHLVKNSEVDVIILTLHHALYDARSISILVNELEELYHRRPMKGLASFSSFVASTIQGSNAEQSGPFWEKALKLNQKTLIGTRCDNHNDDLSVESLQRNFQKGLNEIQSRCHSIDVSVPSLILLSIGRALARIVGISHPTFGLFQSGRSGDYPGIQNLAGPTVNMLPVVIPNALKSSTVEGLLSVQHDLIQRVSHDQSDLGTIHRIMSNLGKELRFNLTVNIVWTQSHSNGVEDETHSIFTPVAIHSHPRTEFAAPISKTSIDQLDWKSRIDPDAVYLEVSPDEKHTGLHWKLDFTSTSISQDEAEAFLNALEVELNSITESI